MLDVLQELLTKMGKAIDEQRADFKSLAALVMLQNQVIVQLITRTDLMKHMSDEADASLRELIELALPLARPAGGGDLLTKFAEQLGRTLPLNL